MPNNPCDAWHELIFGKNRGQIYDFFNRHREKLIKHLQHCDICEKLIVQVLPMPTLIDDLGDLTPQEFAILIRQLYSNAQGVLFEDDSVNMDHD
ncbi:MAG: hypothetical protein G01um101444_351 [Parcubacteria group bacterium Gr01-1014_44]|nr:MAG: hypothetical protein G01um101444_351 [Parcubacteria group bacterium Gr01-1014_44]